MKNPSNSSKVVLVVEDNEVNMMMLRDLLEAHNYSVLQVRNGIEGWRSANEHHPDVVLMDIQLPDVSGLEVTRWLKDDEALKEIPIIAVTAFAMKGDEEKMLAGGCDAYVPKPVSIPELLHTIEHILSEWDPSPTLRSYSAC